MNITRDMDKNIFRAYDIRGVYGVNITEDVYYTIGRAFATKIKRLGENMCLVGHDNRLSSSSLNEALVSGIMDSGVDVIDLGLVTTPMFYYARIKKQIRPGLMITASHNPKDENGLKFAFTGVAQVKGEEIYEFRDFIINNSFDEGTGTLYRYDIREEYIELFKRCLNFGNRRLKVVLDCANGTTSIIAKELYSLFPIDITMLYDESDGNFPNHHPDPSEEKNLETLKKKVLEVNADLGIGFDGDGDRAGFVDKNGDVLDVGRFAIIIIKELLKNNDNKNILFDLKCSNIVKEEVLKAGGNPIEFRTGASYTMAKVIEDDMLFGFEYSGHIYFNDLFPPISSGLYAGLKILEILSNTNKDTNELLGNINTYYEEPEIRIHSDDDKKWNVVENIKKYAIEKGYKISDIDGVKIYYEDGWGLVRCSNTGPNITLRFEAKNKEALNRIKDEVIGKLNDFNK